VSRESRTNFQADRSRDINVEGGDEADPAAAGGVAPGAGEGGGDERGAQQIEALRKLLSEAEENARAQRELYLRAAAEIENVRKRAQRDIEQAHRYAIEGLAAELLPVRDNLELGLRNATNADAKTLLAGQEATLKVLQRAFDKFSIRQIDPVGERFDPNQHEAVLMQEAAGAPANTVLQVVQSGYDLNGRLLRPARVIVARASDGGGG
jgi:molecular chaperone GrpE